MGPGCYLDVLEREGIINEKIGLRAPLLTLGGTFVYGESFSQKAALLSCPGTWACMNWLE